MLLETDITIIVKTFSRPTCLLRLINSIRKYYPNIKIIVVDDSKNSTHISGDSNLEYHVLPFAQGTSFGRNYGLSKVKTKYFMSCDDDFIFTPKTNLQIRYDILENTDIDLVATDVADNQNRKPMLLHIDKGTLYRWKGSKGESFGYPLCDYTPQCFLSRTDKFIEVGGWDEQVLVWDHLFLFIRLLNKLKITMLSVIDIDHKPQTNEIYKSYRWGERLDRDRKLLKTKYGIQTEKLEAPPGYKK